jgi:tetratricopeptide (TPR) repeat protein
MIMSHRLWVALLVFVQLFASALADSITDGDDALQKFNLALALASYRQAYTNAPSNYEAAWKLTRALIDKGTLSKQRAEQKKLFAEAEQTARKAVQLNPKDAKGHVYLAIAVGKLALFEGGKRKVELSKEIKLEADKATGISTNEDLAYHVIGVWNREMVELNWALKQFAQLLYGKFPASSLVAAENNLRRATEIAPNTIAHHVELGITLKAAGKPKEAQEEFAKALQLPKTWVTDDYYRELAKRYYKPPQGN